MNSDEAKKILDKVVGQVFGYTNPLTLEQAMQKFAFDVPLPQQVYDATDNSPTWASSVGQSRYVKLENARNNAASASEGLYAKVPINNVEELLDKWSRINFVTTEREIDSINIAESDNVIGSENVYRSQDIRRSKNILFSDGLEDSEFIVAGQRCGANTFCIRIEDSGECSNSFGISWSTRITNCLFIHDSADMQDSMFCSNIKGKRFCIANMQFTEEEYKHLHKQVVQWILTPSS
ncbi:hypothetical protein KC959_01565 [Candidatus Saccharibacteria bacterium]|nr:hypothetical protein [Candidatus Saccharibacteria bacterium]